MEREDFVRLKKVQEYKKKRIEEEEEKLAALQVRAYTRTRARTHTHTHTHTHTDKVAGRQEAGLAPASYAVPSMLDKPTDDDDLFS